MQALRQWRRADHEGHVGLLYEPKPPDHGGVRNEREFR